MPDDSKKLRRATILYWFLLVYIIVALIWWASLLLQQNHALYQLRKDAVTNSAYDKSSPQFLNALAAIEDQRRRNTIKYAGEGLIFLLFIIIGAIFIYRSVRRQFRLQQQQQNFVMAITHELKTPISVARLNLETLQRHSLDEEKKKKLLQSSLQETMRLDTLINNILVLSQLDAGDYDSAKEELDLSDLVADTIQQFQSRYPERKINTAIQKNIEFTGDALLLKLLVSNLLENANKYSAKPMPVGCRLSKEADAIKLEVADEGAGIEDEEKKNIFQKFYRIGNEQTRKTQGTGLGLYLCKKIAAHHEANIYVTDNLPTGSNFIVEFFV